MDAFPRCARHPGVRAGWRCRSCGALLCPGCAASTRAGTDQVAACTHCGGVADQCTVPRSAVSPYPARLWRAVRYPFSTSTVLAVLACAAVMVLLSWVPGIGGALAFGISWAFFLGVLRQSAFGAVDFQPPDDVDLLDAVVLPAVRGLLALALLWVPAAFRIAGQIAAGARTGDEILLDPLLWLILLAGALYAPAALMQAAFGQTVGMLNPLRVVGTAVRLGRDYLLAVAVVTLVLGADLVVGVLFPSAFGSIPFVSGLLRTAAGLVAPTFAAHALGLLLYVRGDAVELGRPEDYLVPVLPGAVPRGVEPARVAEALDPAAHVRPTSNELEPEPAPAAPAPAPAALEIARLAGEGDLAGAARLCQATRPPPPLTPAVAFAVGRGAYQAGAVEVAAEALHAAGVAGDPAVSPAALLVLGRLYQRRLARPDDARQVFEYLVQAFPDSDAAAHGRAALQPPAPGTPP